MSSAMEAFDKSAEAVDTKSLAGKKKFAPSIYLHTEDNANQGKYVLGKFLHLRLVPNKRYKNQDGSVKMDPYLDIRLVSTNHVAETKTDKGFKAVEVKEGDIVSIRGTAILRRFAESLEAGTMVKITYIDEKLLKGNDGKKRPSHDFELKKAPGTLTEEDINYIAEAKAIDAKRASRPAVSAAEPSVDEEGAANLAALED